MRKEVSKKAQIGLFVIVAIVIIAAAIITYFVVRQKAVGLPEEIRNIENSYIDCLESLANYAKNDVMLKAGYIYQIPSLPEGSYFSNNLVFMGEKIPYWRYFDVNGIAREQVPSLNDIEREISEYIRHNINGCDDVFRNYKVEFSKNVTRIDTKISEGNIEINVIAPVQIKKENATYLITEHKVILKSNLKKLYENARKIYEYEKATGFLENYTLDIITLYAPTTGFEIQCVPLAFNKERIKKDIIDGISVNFERIKFRGDYFGLKEKENIYFLSDAKIDDGITANIIAPLSPTKIDVYAGEDEGKTLKFDPIGNQQGMQIAGLCYVPYHLVYDVKFPLLISLSYRNEFFNFPITIVIERNNVKHMLEENETLETRICKNANTDMEVVIYDEYNNIVDGDVYFKCLDAVCYIGKSEDGFIEGKIPQCINGFLIVRAEGYAEKKLQVDSNYDVSAVVFLKKIQEVKVELNLKSNEEALLMFEGENSVTVMYPENKEINITTGSYNVTLYVFKQKNVSVSGESEICYDVPLLYLTTKKCVKLDMISVDRVVIGGGKTIAEITEEMLDEGELRIDFERFKEPTKLEEIEENYAMVDEKEILIR